MLSSVEQAFVGRKEIRAPLKTPAWEANCGFVCKRFSLMRCFLSNSWKSYLDISTLAYLDLTKWKDFIEDLQSVINDVKS